MVRLSSCLNRIQVGARRRMRMNATVETVSGQNSGARTWRGRGDGRESGGEYGQVRGCGTREGGGEMGMDGVQEQLLWADTVQLQPAMRLQVGRVGSAGSGNIEQAIYTAAVIEGLRETGSSGSGLSLNMMDPDPEIEEHNLNRQVLYTKEDIGSQKAIVAERKVSRDLPDSTVASFVSSVGIPHLIGLENTGYSLDPSIEEDDDDIFSDHDDIYSVTGGLIAESDVLVSGVDNLRDRSILNAISSKLGITMVNAGAQGFNGQFDLFTPDGSCMLCRYGMHALREGVRMSCQEDGDVPFSSIVTSTAIFGALEGLALLSILSEGPDSPPDWPTSISWNGRVNSFRASERGSDIFTDAFSHEGPHHAHLYNRLMGLGGPGHQ